MIADVVLQFSDLQELCHPGGKPRLSTVDRWARAQGIRFLYDGRGGIWTTVAALNEALGLEVGIPSKDRPYSVDELFGPG